MNAVFVLFLTLLAYVISKAHSTSLDCESHKLDFRLANSSSISQAYFGFTQTEIHLVLQRRLTFVSRVVVFKAQLQNKAAALYKDTNGNADNWSIN